jgi:hypothetical protein
MCASLEPWRTAARPPAWHKRAAARANNPAALSPLAKAGYTNHVAYSHGSTLRSVQEIFGLTPLLGGAASATNLSDLFRSFP